MKNFQEFEDNIPSPDEVADVIVEEIFHAMSNTAITEKNLVQVLKQGVINGFAKLEFVTTANNRA